MEINQLNQVSYKTSNNRLTRPQNRPSDKFLRRKRSQHGGLGSRSSPVGPGSGHTSATPSAPVAMVVVPGVELRIDDELDSGMHPSVPFGDIGDVEPDSIHPLTGNVNNAVNSIPLNLTASTFRPDTLEDFSSSKSGWNEEKTDHYRHINRLATKQPYKWYHAVLCLFSMFSYLFDVISDVYLSFTYYIEGDFYWFVLTLAIFLVPAITITLFSVCWYSQDMKNSRDEPKSCTNWTLKSVLHLFQLAPVARYLDTIYYGIKSQNKHMGTVCLDYYEMMLFEEADSAMLRMLESFMEAAPQLLLQLYILLTQSDDKTTQFKFYIQIVSCLSSWISLAWCMMTYHTAMRSMRSDKENMSVKGMVCMFFWKFGVIGTRILALALFTSAFGSWVFLILGVHWLVMFVSIRLQKTRFCDSGACRLLTEFLFNVVVGFIYCFEFLNVQEGHTRLRYLFYYSIVYMENIAMVFFWYLDVTESSLLLQLNTSLDSIVISTSPQPLVVGAPACCSPEVAAILLGTVVVGFWVGIGLCWLYYLAFHPTQNIKLCLSRDDLCLRDRSHTNRASSSVDVQMGSLSPVSQRIPPVTVTSPDLGVGDHFPVDEVSETQGKNNTRHNKNKNRFKSKDNCPHGGISSASLDSEHNRWMSNSQFTAEISTYSYEAEPRLTAV